MNVFEYEEIYIYIYIYIGFRRRGRESLPG